MSDIIFALVAILLFGYLLGSIPFGFILTQLFRGVDVTSQGSGRTGATNVLRAAGWKAAVAVVLLDAAKAASAVYLSKIIIGANDQLVAEGIYLFRGAQILAAMAAVVGHNWSIFLDFKGGRGVVAFLGGLFALSPAAALFGGEMLLLVAGLTRYVSLGSLVGTVAAWALLVPLVLFNRQPAEYLLYALAGALLILFQHRDNVSRLLAGTERKMGKTRG
ncbi:MAG: glycerol-3-phosphate 1-O-acyltransferase PlsY [Dehalococcoidia bacterium]|nr:glycerol-3-phosphate 1-O-acyltransferase PlsY [Dehalococcoidia bacterium]